MNKVFLIGNLTRDPEVRTSNTGKEYVTLSVAVNIRGANGQQEANFYNVRAFRQIDALQRYLTKGRKVAVTGSLTLRLYDGNDGSKRIAADVLADDVEFLPSGAPQGEGGGGSYAPQRNDAAPFGHTGNENGFSQVEDDDLPF